MSSPEDEHSPGSYHASSQEAAGGVLHDTASLRHATFRIGPGSEARESRPQPNTQFSQRLSDVRSRSTSPRLHHMPLLFGVSVEQQWAQMAEQLASSAVSGIGQVSQRMHYAQSVAETAISEARIIRKTVEEEIAQTRAHADASALTVAHDLSNKIDQVAAGAAQIASRVVGDTSRQLESGLRAVTTSTAATAEITPRTAIEGVSQQMQSQFDHERKANRL